MKKLKLVKSGIELEVCLNADLIDYSRLRLLKGWRIHNDGSLRADKFRNHHTIEFVSNVCTGKSRFKKKIDDFKNFIIKESGADDLSKVLSFNSSCGTHIHMGVNYSEIIGDKLPIELINEFRNNFFEGLDNINIKKPLAKNIKEHYFRSYSRKTTKKTFSIRSGRYREINKVSESTGKGLEWRSFNLLGVDNWDDFTKVIMFAYDCFESLIKHRIHGYELPTKRIKIIPELIQPTHEVITINTKNNHEIIEVDR